MKNYRIYLFMCLLVFVSCDFSNKTDRDQPVKEIPDEGITLKDLGEVIEIDSSAEPVSLAEVGLPFEGIKVDDSTYVYQGDILIDVSDTIHPLEPGQTVPRSATARTKGMWPNNTMYYQINSALDANLQTRIREAVRVWGSVSNVKFVEGTGTGAYVMFTSGSGCASFIGMTGRMQNITLSTACSTGSIIHEIGHALGFWHEQARADRDKHIKINFANITVGTEHNFKSYIEMGYDGQELSNMDFGSIMMYPSHAFSRNGLPTITKLDGSTYTIQRTKPSALDIAGMNKLYPAPTAPTPTEPTPVPIAPTYENGKMYVVQGLSVYRANDRWYYLSRSSGFSYWREVVLVNGVWKYS